MEVNGTDLLYDDIQDEVSYAAFRSCKNPAVGKQFLPKEAKPMPERITDSSDDDEQFRSNDSAFNFDKSFITSSANTSAREPMAGTSGTTTKNKGTKSHANLAKPPPFITKLSRTFKKTPKK